MHPRHKAARVRWRRASSTADMVRVGGMSGAAAFTSPFFSPLALATLFGALGGFGLIAKHGFDASDATSLAVAGPAALGTSYLVTCAAWRLIRSSTE